MTQPTCHMKKGYTMVELTLVMLLLALFGITILTLIQSGSTAYAKIVDNRNAESDARVALNYLDVRMRQNDVQGAIFIQPSPLGQGNAMVIREEYDGVSYDTWIYFHDGVLYECNLLDAGKEPTLEQSDPIAALTDFYFEALPGKAIRQVASYPYHTTQVSEIRTLESMLVLRSGGGIE